MPFLGFLGHLSLLPYTSKACLHCALPGPFYHCTLGYSPWSWLPEQQRLISPLSSHILHRSILSSYVLKVIRHAVINDHWRLLEKLQNNSEPSSICNFHHWFAIITQNESCLSCSAKLFFFPSSSVLYKTVEIDTVSWIFMQKAELQSSVPTASIICEDQDQLRKCWREVGISSYCEALLQLKWLWDVYLWCSFFWIYPSINPTPPARHIYHHSCLLAEVLVFYEHGHLHSPCFPVSHWCHKHPQCKRTDMNQF